MERRGNHRHSAGSPWYLRTLSMILAITMILTSTGVTALAESQDAYPESATEQQVEAPAQAEEAAPAPQPETAAPVVETQPETAAPVAETQAETAAPETSAPKQEETAAPAAESETAAPATEAETKGETVTESGKTTKTQNKEETAEKESKAEEKETKKDIVYKMVTFDVADGAVVTVKQKQIEKSSGDHTAKAEDGKIVFSINVKDGYRLGESPCRRIH